MIDLLRSALSERSEPLAWAILHSLWQIAIVAAAYAAVAYLLRRASASARYVAGCLAIGAMALLPMVTFARLELARPAPRGQIDRIDVDAGRTFGNAQDEANRSRGVASAVNLLPGGALSDSVAADGAAADSAAADSAAVVAEVGDSALGDTAAGDGPPAVATLRDSSAARFTEFLGDPQWRRVLSWVSGGWLVGALLFSLRPLWGLAMVRRLRRAGLSLPTPAVAQLMEDVAARLRIGRPVRLAISTLVDVPLVLGYLRPLVLLPASIAANLSAAELEMILAHELAHIRRHDYLVNLFQCACETLLFYHPAMWWVSQQVRAERENSCDDLVVTLCADRAAYVRVLVAIEAQRGVPRLALAATGGSLLARARRLLVPARAESPLQRVAACLAGLLPITLAVAALSIATLLTTTGSAVDEPLRVAAPQVVPAEAEPPVEVVVTAGEPVRPAEPEPVPDAAGPFSQPPGEVAPNVPTVVQAKGESAAAAQPAEAPKPPQQPQQKLLDTANPKLVDRQPGAIMLKVDVEDDAKISVEAELFDQYMRSVKTWQDLTPGNITFDMPDLATPARYYLHLRAKGYADGRISLSTTAEGLELNRPEVTLYRRRYAIVRYAVNMQGERELTGPDVKQGRVAISYANIPDLHGDWRVLQEETTPTFMLHRYQAGNGFVVLPNGVDFDAFDVAPQPDQYKPENLPAAKGEFFFTRIVGDGKDWRRYAKVLVEDVTETPPEGVQVIDTNLPPTFVKARPRPRVELDSADDAPTSGEFALATHIEGDVKTPIKVELRNDVDDVLHVWDDVAAGEKRLRLPELEQGHYSLVLTAEGQAPVRVKFDVAKAGLEPATAKVELHRVRYVVLRYVINTKGERTLTGPDVTEGRLAIGAGQVPGLIDWRVIQRDGIARAHVVRILSNTGFAMAPEEALFADLSEAPANDAYQTEDLFFAKGDVFYNRVVGHRPETARYAKLLVEDVTETPPTDVKIVTEWRYTY